MVRQNGKGRVRGQQERGGSVDALWQAGRRARRPTSKCRWRGKENYSENRGGAGDSLVELLGPIVTGGWELRRRGNKVEGGDGRMPSGGYRWSLLGIDLHVWKRQLGPRAVGGKSLKEGRGDRAAKRNLGLTREIREYAIRNDLIREENGGRVGEKREAPACLSEFGGKEAG